MSAHHARLVYICVNLNDIKGDTFRAGGVHTTTWGIMGKITKSDTFRTMS